MGRHRNQIVRGLSAQSDDFVCGETLFRHACYRCYAELFELVRLFLEILLGLVTHAGEQFVIVPRVEALVAGIHVIRYVIGAEQLDFETELSCHLGDDGQYAFGNLGTIQRHDDRLEQSPSPSISPH